MSRRATARSSPSPIPATAAVSGMEEVEERCGCGDSGVREGVFGSKYCVVGEMYEDEGGAEDGRSSREDAGTPLLTQQARPSSAVLARAQVLPASQAYPSPCH